MIGGWQDAQASAAGVQCRLLLAVQQLHFTHQQCHTHKQLEFIGCKKTSGTLSGPRAERHTIVSDFLTEFVKLRFIFSVFYETVKLEML